jgi:hypothetical protein
MPLVRREPHPALPPGWELRSFECPVCERVQILSVEMIRQQKAGYVPAQDFAILDEEKEARLLFLYDWLHAQHYARAWR